MKVKEFVLKMNELCPFYSAYDWDNVGLLVGNTESEIKGIYIALDISDKVIDSAKESGCNLILTHHPMIFKPINRVVNTDMNGKRIMNLIKNDINYIAMHTNYDVHIMWKLVAERLGFLDAKVLDITEEENGVAVGIGSVCELEKPLSLRALCSEVKEKMDLPFVTYYGEENAPVKRIAVVPGSGKSEIKTALLKGADVLITGDITHHEGIDAKESGLNIIDAGHDGLENAFIYHMRDYIISNFQDIIVKTAPIDIQRRTV